MVDKVVGDTCCDVCNCGYVDGNCNNECDCRESIKKDRSKNKKEECKNE